MKPYLKTPRIERDDLIYPTEVFEIIGAAMAVRTELGPGFLESVYQEALEMELAERKIPFTPQKPLCVHYKGKLLTKSFIADLVCYDKIIVELKAISRLTNTEEAQIINYLKVTEMKVGLLINFASKEKLEWVRKVN
jgi:GxxExxY protein